ncbi:hypothetical protein M758_11G059000 [Ceratodon purpureus]|nr:hypothetical protein M758_11G059000 [Ceratodon purpureus]
MLEMAALLQASIAPCTTLPRVSTNISLQCRSIASFSGTSLGKPQWYPKSSPTERHPHRRPGVARANRNPDTIIEKTCQVGDHFLDSVSNYILRQIQKPLAKYVPHDWDPLQFLPVNIQSNLQKSEALATLVLREAIVVAAFYLVYRKVNAFCRWLYRVYTHEQSSGEKVHDEAAYAASPFQAAQLPLQGLVVIWASTRLLWVMSVLCKMQAVITEETVYDIRGTSFVLTITWFLFRWKKLLVSKLVKQRPLDETRRIVVIDKILSLGIYGIAASAIAEVVGMPLASLLAVGGISGIAVGLAAKEVISNMFGGASLFLTRPFVIGEKIKAGKISGAVQDIGFMQTKVRGNDGVPVFVPNQTFTRQVITNFSRAKTKVLKASFQLHNRHMFLVHRITSEVRNYLSSHQKVETERATPICWLDSMHRNGPQLAISCEIKAIETEAFCDTQQEILLHTAKIITDILGTDSPYAPLVEDPSSEVKVVDNQS